MRTLRSSLMGTVILALLCGAGAVVAQDEEQARADAVAVTQANEAANIDAFYAQDLDAYMATLTEDPGFEDQTFGDYLEGVSAVRRVMGWTFAVTDAEATELLDHFVSSDGSRAVQIFQWTGTSDRGRPFDLPIVLVDEYRDGKIAKQSVYYAARDTYAQLKESLPAE